MPMASGLIVASWLVVASGLAPRWAAKRPQTSYRGLSDGTRWPYWGRFAAQRGASPLATTSPLATASEPSAVKPDDQGCHTVFSPLNLRSRNVAALINAKWLRACGVLPRCRAWLSNSSAYNPSGLA